MRNSVNVAFVCFFTLQLARVSAFMSGAYTRTSYGNAPGSSGCAFPTICNDLCARQYTVTRVSLGNYIMTPTVDPTSHDSCQSWTCHAQSLEGGIEQASGIVSGTWKSNGVSVGTMWIYEESDTVFRVDMQLSTESRWCRAYYDSNPQDSSTRLNGGAVAGILITIIIVLVALVVFLYFRYRKAAPSMVVMHQPAQVPQPTVVIMESTRNVVPTTSQGVPHRVEDVKVTADFEAVGEVPRQGNFCPNCGKPRVRGANFCDNCGNKAS